MYADTAVRIQNRSDLYAELVAEGIYEAELVAADPFANGFGARVGLVFRLLDGRHAGAEVMQSAAPGSPTGKLADLLRALGATEGTLAAARAAIGKRCRVAIRHGATKSGKVFAGIEKTYG